MQSFNVCYESHSQLEEFISLHKLKEQKNIFIQIFSGFTDPKKFMPVSKKLKKLLPQANIMGATTCGEILNGEMLEYTISISISIFESTQVQSKMYTFDDNFEVAKVGDELIEDDTKAMIIFSDGLKSNADNILHDVYRLKPDMIISGGRAADNLTFTQTYIFDHERYCEDGCIIASLSGDSLIVNSDYMLYWTPIGRDMIITKAKENVLYELNNIPILEVYKKYLGEDIVYDLSRVCMEFPLIIKHDGVKIARAPLLKRDDGGLMFAGNLEEGDSVRFSFGNIEDIANHSHERFTALKKLPAEAVYVYSCSARRELMGEKLDDEVMMLESIAPSAGFFTYGEYFHAATIVELLNVTTTFMLLSEVKKVPKRELKEHNVKDYDSVRRALAHLVKITNQELEHVSSHDYLTGLYNRSEYLKYIERKIKGASRYGEDFGLILVDIDFFKLVNDNYGHNVGDKVLSRFANILKDNIREDDFVARWGGEEFIIIANHVTIKNLEKLVQKLQKKIAKVNFKPVPRLTASFGLTTYVEGDSYEEMFKRVDNALYLAKQNGRDRYIIG
ncbi:sensor domain-containing diguanylate cyclase [Sulfurimonas sp.]